LIPRKPLVVIFLFDIQSEIDNLHEKVKMRQFENAILSADRILKLDTRFVNSAFMTRVETLNNYGFCLININSLERAKSILASCGNQHLLSKCNLAFIYFLEENIENSCEILKKIVKKAHGKDHNVAFIHLAIKHKCLLLENLIVENTNIYNIACWNMSLISAYEGKDDSVINSYLKKVILKNNEHYINARVKSWIHYIKNEFEQASSLTAENLAKMGESYYMYNDIKKDIEIFNKAKPRD